ncbi:hypothetical protein NBRC110019_30170 [Neptunitalea chrysea]|uniref:HTH marR-type domain-containing protein n=1 Tax=Neptunitalea chrysea TaxID=1647581 RepID=A0A9W6EW91_9FLAO|nr:MarR family winged helix-turn-helix transcriptional regulator [Neptunitalea chrysea]GLB53976.1 hypothetical protein NBRC110019_30170 [Neptunitalea chrysea]
MSFNTPTKTVLYSIEETIKAYRKLSQYNISSIVPKITIDQALILIIISHSDNTQTEIANLIFKDYASMTRIINLMISKDYLTKTLDKIDKRKAKLKITENGKIIIEKLTPMIKLNRETALKNISYKEQEQLFKILKKITQNCKTIDNEN